MEVKLNEVGNGCQIIIDNRVVTTYKGTIMETVVFLKNNFTNLEVKKW